VRTSVRIPRGTKEIVCVPGCLLRTWMGFLREPLRATLATVEAPVVYAAIIAPLPLLYATNQVQVTTHNHIMQRVPWESEVSVDLFIRDVADKVERRRPRSADRLNVATLLQEDS
jgi:hypothetical protein